MNYRLLERRTADKYEQIKFFEDFISHYTEGDGWTKTATSTYVNIGVSRDKCVQQYLDQGFMEVENA